MLHSHPLPNGQRGPSWGRSPMTDRMPSCSPPTLLSGSIATHQYPWARQNHLLNLRTTGFNRSLRDSLSRSQDSSPTLIGVNESTRGSPTSQENQFSASQRAGLGSWRRRSRPVSIGASIYTDPRQPSPDNPDKTSYPYPNANMRLRELSFNSRTSPGNNGYQVSKQTKSTARRSPGSRFASFEASKYIEHLEAELETTQKQLKLFNSPSTSESHLARLRTLETENHKLRQDIATWEEKFHDRIHNELEDRIELEGGLRAKIKFLEKDRETRIARVGELEDRIELEGGLRAKINFLEKERDTKEANIIELGDRLSTLGADVHDLHVENCLLRQQITQKSPVNSSRFSTPGPPDESKENTPCPALSMISRQSSASFGSYNNRISATNITTPSAFSSDLVDEGESQLSHANCQMSADLESPLQGYFSAIPRSGSTLSSLCYSPTMSEGRPVATGLHRGRSQNMKRRMRRFSAGASGPKALLLQTNQPAETQPTSAPPGDPPKPWDEITPRAKNARPFLRRTPHRRPLSETNINCHQKRASWADAANELEHDIDLSPLDIRKRYSQPPSQGSFAISSRTSSQMTLRSRPQSLCAELSNVQEDVAESWCQESTPQTDDKAENSPKHRNLASDPSSVPLRRHDKSKSVNLDSASLSRYVLTSWDDAVLLARRVVYNAWMNGSRRSFIGDTGWWIFQLLFGVKEYPKDKKKSRQNTAELLHGEMSTEASHRRWMESIAGQLDGNGLSADQFADLDEERLRRCELCVFDSNEGWLWPWAQFSAALVLALGIAVKEGPSALLGDSSDMARNQARARLEGRDEA